MKRRFVLILLLLVGGAIVNVGVAWGCAVAASPKAPPEYTASQVSKELREFLHHWKSVGHMRYERIYTFLYINGQEPLRPDLPRVVLQSGWPTYAMSCSAYGSGDTYNGDTSDSVIGFEASIIVERTLGGLALTPDSSTEAYSSWRALPLRPIWPGFAINTVFYAGILWLLFAGPFVLRRLRGGQRIRRGLCPKCAYDLRGTPDDATACPECGTSLKNA